MKLFFPNWKSTLNNTYRKCDEMPLWNFQKYLETNDLKYFTKNLKEVKGLDVVMNDFFVEYLELTKNNSVFRKFSNIYKLLKLEGKYKCVTLLTTTLYNYDIKMGVETFNNLLLELDKWGHKIDTKLNIFDQLENISQRNRVLETQIQALQIELKKDDQQESQTIESQLISVSRILELKYKLDSKEITVMEWIEFQKQAELVIKNQKKNGK